MHPVLSAIAALAAASSLAQAQPSLQILPYFTSDGGMATLSADGQLATIAISAGPSGGYNLTQWTPGGVTTQNGVLADRGVLVPTAGSRNGRYIVGTAGVVNGGTQVFISSPVSGGTPTFATLPTFSGYGLTPQAVSENGQYVAGGVLHNNPNASNVFRTTVSSGATQFGPDNGASYPTFVARHGVSDNGVVAGTYHTSLAGHGQNFRFDDNGYSVLRSALIAQPVWVAQDGSAIIDAAEFGSLSRWTSSGNSNVSQPFGFVSTNGTEIIASPNAVSLASVWNSGPLTLWRNGGVGSAWQGTSVAAWIQSAGLSTAGWNFQGVYGLTDDGETILGYATYQGTQVSFIASGVPAPSTAGVLGLLVISASRRPRR